MAKGRVVKLGPHSIFSNKERLEELLELYYSGVKWGEIEKQLGVSHGTCYNALKAIGVLGNGGQRYKRLSNKACKSLVEEYKKGKTIETLRKKYEISRDYCCDVIRKAGLSCYSKKLFFYNPENIESLKKDYEDGLTWREISEKHGLAAETCRNYLHLAGVPLNRKREVTINQEKIEQCVHDYVSSVSIKEISEKYNFPVARVYQILKEAGVYKRKHRTAVEIFENSEEVAFVVQVYRSGVTMPEMEEKLGINKSTIKKILKMANEPERDVTMVRKKARKKND